MNYNIKIDFRGDKHYYLDNVLYAIEFSNGTKTWFKNGLFHREDGPAIEYANGNKEWWLKHKIYGFNNAFTYESWKKFVKTLIFS